MLNYNCHAFHAALPKGKASGQLVVTERVFKVSVNGQHLELSMQGLSLRLGGANKRLIFFKHQAYPDWEFYTADHQLLRSHYFDNFPDLKVFARNTKMKKIWARTLLMTIIGILICLPLLFLMRLDVLTGMVARKVPPAWEEKLGTSAIAQYQLSKHFMPNEQFQAFLEPLVHPLLKVLEDSRYGYDFHIVQDSSLNAFALPGGQVIIHSELILKADSAEEFLGVIGHEIAHVEEQHGVRNVIGAAGLYSAASLVFGDASGILALLTTAAPYLLNQTYSRKFETKADAIGSKLLETANIDPSGLAIFFEKIILEEEKKLATIENEDMRDLVKEGFQFLSSHPSSSARIERLGTLVKKIRLENSRKDRAYEDLSNAFSHLQKVVAEYASKGDQKQSEKAL